MTSFLNIVLHFEPAKPHPFTMSHDFIFPLRGCHSRIRARSNKVIVQWQRNLQTAQSQDRAGRVGCRKNHERMEMQMAITALAIMTRNSRMANQKRTSLDSSSRRHSHCSKLVYLANGLISASASGILLCEMFGSKQCANGPSLPSS